MDRRTLQRIEAGQIDPRSSDFLRIAAALDTPVSVTVSVTVFVDRPGKAPPIRHGRNRRAGPLKGVSRAGASVTRWGGARRRRCASR
ncbi:helix-turn-helix domain-containing protein [Streptomyces echinoruber]|uniref:helix-turn-helix domain-containing protein n=1 Tax=Streptomyces echinoruber TaxID=68898 RepID=UPI003570EB3D